MNSYRVRFDSVLFILVLLNTLFGFLMFFSSSLGVMARYEAKFFGILNNQFFYGVVLGLLAFAIGILTPYRLWERLSYFIWPIAFVLCILVFIPGIGYSHGGARRWIDIFGFNLQPSEILKYANIFLLSALYAKNKDYFHDWKSRLLPVIFLLLSAAIVAIEPDFGTTSILVAGIGAIFLGTAAKWHDIVVFSILLIFGSISFYFAFPHARERIDTFLNPSEDTLGSDYQIRQNLISLGSGGFFGHGYGQGTQKYHHLPEPVGDSIFASIGEELGFFGSIITLFFALFINLRILYISYFIRDYFGKGILIGVSVTLLAQTFLNIGSVSGAIPLTGVPLPLISHGSTSLIFTLGMLGICTQILGRREIYRVEV